MMDGTFIAAFSGQAPAAGYVTTMVKWVVPEAEPSWPVIATWNVPGADGSVPEIWPLVECGIAWMDRPGGSPDSVKCSDATFLVSRPVIFSEKGVPWARVWLPGSISVTRRTARRPNAVVPLGVPSPVGPSKPRMPWHRYACAVPHWPLTPEVTSNRFLACRYGYSAG